MEPSERQSFSHAAHFAQEDKKYFTAEIAEGAEKNPKKGFSAFSANLCGDNVILRPVS